VITVSPPNRATAAASSSANSAGIGTGVLEATPDAVTIVRDLPGDFTMEGEINFYAISSVYDPQNPENLIDAPEDLVTGFRGRGRRTSEQRN
jgi:hypothetical protein